MTQDRGDCALPEQLDAGLERFLDVVHSRLNVSVCQLTKPRNHFRFRVAIVTRVDLQTAQIRHIDAATAAVNTIII